MAKRKVVNKVVVDKNATQFMRTAQNLARKGKTNKNYTVAMLTQKHKNTQFSVFFICIFDVA